jgi:uncharacterized protein (DUF924 family)
MTAENLNSAETIATPLDILTFWRAAGPDRWFKKDDAFDADIRTRFMTTYEAAAAGRLRHWEDTPGSALALVIVLDQFPRNMFRGSARAFAADPIARTIADRAISRGDDRKFPLIERQFFYLPFEHSEHYPDQQRCVALFGATDDAEMLKWAALHADIIRRFGRFPHRNATLGRANTAEEQAFLDGGGFGG